LSWLLWILLTIVAIALSLWHYHRRETPGRGRTLLALLRSAALALVLLLLFDPELPDGAATSARGALVLLDGSLSLDSAAWTRAVARARELADDRSVLVFGDDVRPIHPDSLPATAPGDPRSRLLPALQAAAEAGVRGVVVVTDGRLEDVEAAARWVPRLALDVETELVGGDVANRAIAEVSAPAWVQAGEPLDVEFGVTAPAGADPVGVVVRQGGRILGRSTVPAPAAGRLATGSVQVRVEAPESGGWVALEVALEGADPIADDDVRTVYVQASAQPAGIALVSLRPDWEPRFLAPVLEQALGLPLRAYLRGATGQYIRLGSGLDAGAAATEQDVREAVARAEVLVLHGIGVDAPQWAVDALGSARRLLVFPGAETGTLPLPATVGAEQPGDYFPVAAIPPSPVAPLLAELELGGLAPLTGLRTVQVPEGAWAPLNVTRGRQGQAQPAAIAGTSGGRRWVVALGSGYWQWSFRGGAERQLYTRLWGSLAGWLAQERGTAAQAAVRPAAMSLPRNSPIPWLAPGVAADSVALTVTAADGAVALDTVIAATTADSAFSRAPAPGTYSYRARAFTSEGVVEADGVFAVERYSPELSRPRADLSGLAGDGETLVREDRTSRRGTPLHATVPPYLLLLLILSAEWILRRRWGLR